VLDPVACEVEREHRHDDAVQLGDQSGLAVDRALQDRHGAMAAGQEDAGARDQVAALDRAEVRAGEAAAVGDPDRVGVEEADEGRHVLGLPSLLEAPDDVGVPGDRGRPPAGPACGSGQRLGIQSPT
jgi:hypothetical protein